MFRPMPYPPSPFSHWFWGVLMLVDPQVAVKYGKLGLQGLQTLRSQAKQKGAEHKTMLDI